MNWRNAAALAGDTRIPIMALALLYLAGPMIIMVDLLKPAFWIPALLFFLLWLAGFDSFLFPGSPAEPSPLAPPARPVGAITRWAAPCVIFVLAAAWVCLSGIGSLTYCRYDYIKHDLIFASLLTQHLPIMADPGDGSTAIIHYYFAYYIVPVRIYQGLHALFAFVRLDHVVFLIYALALFASLRVLAASYRVSAGLLFALLALGGGLDVVGHMVYGAPYTPMGRLPLIHLPVYVDLEWWGRPAAPQSPTMNLFWAPQHFFAALIGVALLAAILRIDRPMGARLVHAAVIIVASSLWSPYVAVGLAVVSLGEIGRPMRRPIAQWLKTGGWRAEITPLVWGAAPFPLLLLAFAAAFYAAAAAATPPSVIFADVPIADWLIGFVLRHAVSIFVLVVLATSRFLPGRALVQGSEGRAAMSGSLLATFGFLLAADAVLLSFLHGTYDDWGMRTTLPVSILLAVALCHFLKDWAGKLAKAGAVLLIAVCSLSGLNEMAQSAALVGHCASYNAYAWRDLGSFFGQYVGQKESLLYRRLAREP